MICGSASGTLLPPYVIYKAENVWDTWMTNGPKGYPRCNMIYCSGESRYNRNSHELIDMLTFKNGSLLFSRHTQKDSREKSTALKFRSNAKRTIDCVCLSTAQLHTYMPTAICRFFRPCRAISFIGVYRK